MSKSAFYILIGLLILASGFVIGQESEKTILIKKTKDKITVDGILDENVWKACGSAKNFWQTFPFDSSLALSKTEAFVTFDDEYFYVAAICYDTIKKPYVIQSLKRDFSYPVSDCFVISLDPLCDKTNGFSFGLNPYGVQREGLIAGGGAMGVSTDWDNRWLGEVKRYGDRWTLEMAIPFKTLRYKKDLKEWRVNFSRNDLKRNENSCWVKVPRQYNISTLAFTGKLIWEETPPAAGVNISYIPYLIGKVSKDNVVGTPEKFEGNLGLDAKVALNSSLNFDVTINPDFSQVDVDRQVTNLTRFNLFFPERRNFFIENSDLFANFGFRQIRPFFSRKIGLENGNPIPILGGIRLSGKVNHDWRIGIMDLQTAESKDFNLPSKNYFVAAAQRQVFDRSNLAFILVNSEMIENNRINPDGYNRVAGVDFNLNSKNNKWMGKFFYHHSFSPEKSNLNSMAHASFLVFNDPDWSIEWNHEYVDKDYNAQNGFVPRIQQYDPTANKINLITYWRLEPRINRYFYPKNSIVNKHGPGIYLDQYANSSLTTTDINLRSSYNVFFTNTCSLTVEHHYVYTKLLFPTDVTFANNLPISADDYYYQYAGLSFRTDSRKKVNGNFTFNYGTYFTGKKFSLLSEITLRTQPWGIFYFSYTRDEIQLPNIRRTLDLIGPKIELSFTRNVFFTTFFQYNTQANNFNINSRLQWRFRPMSDLFIVYSDNYYTSDLNNKNRGVVTKLVWWF
ncbi:MAG: DUF5916 domain-containing protein [Bacteroidota bacterium]